MFTRMTRQLTAFGTDLDDALGVAMLFALLFLGLTLSGAA